MKAFKCFALAGLVAGNLAWGAGFLEKEVVFTEAQIQAALARAKPLQLSYGGLVAVAMPSPPQVFLDGDDGRARLAAGVDVEAPGQPAVHVDVGGRAGIRYDDQRKAFYLENPSIDSIASPTLKKEATPAARLAVAHALASYFKTKPVYVLRADGSPQEASARWLLKSVRIEPGRVVAVLSPL